MISSIHLPLVGSAVLAQRHRQCAQVAQLVEQRIENPRVGGSNPPLGTTSLQIDRYFL